MTVSAAEPTAAPSPRRPAPAPGGPGIPGIPDIPPVTLLALLMAAYVAAVPLMVPDGILGGLPLQAADIVFVPLFAATAWQVLRGGLPPPRFPAWMVGAFGGFLGLGLVAVLGSGRMLPSLAPWLIEVYLVALALVTALVFGQDRRAWRFGVAVFVAVGGTAFALALLGAGLAVAGIPNPWAYLTSAVANSLPVGGVASHLPRVLSTLRPTANMVALLAICVIGPAVFLGQAGRTPWLRLLGWMTAGFALVMFPLTFSFSLMGFAVAACLLLFGLTGQRFRPLRPLAVAATAACVLLVLFASSVHVLKLKAAAGHDPGAVKPLVTDDRGGPLREDIWYFFMGDRGAETFDVSIRYAMHHYAYLKYVAVKIFGDHPVLGAGPGQFGAARVELARQGRIDPGMGQVGTRGFSSAQSEPLNVLAERGVAGLAALFVLAGMAWALLRRRAGDDAEIALFRRCAAASLIGLAVASWNVEISHLRFLWVLIGLLAAVSLCPGRSSGGEGRTP